MLCLPSCISTARILSDGSRQVAGVRFDTRAQGRACTAASVLMCAPRCARCFGRSLGARAQVPATRVCSCNYGSRQVTGSTTGMRRGSRDGVTEHAGPSCPLTLHFRFLGPTPRGAWPHGASRATTRARRPPDGRDAGIRTTAGSLRFAPGDHLPKPQRTS